MRSSYSTDSISSSLARSIRFNSATSIRRLEAEQPEVYAAIAEELAKRRRFGNVPTMKKSLIIQPGKNEAELAARIVEACELMEATYERGAYSKVTVTRSATIKAE